MNKWNRFPLLHNKKASNFYGNNFPSYIPREKLCWSHLSLKYTRFENEHCKQSFHRYEHEKQRKSKQQQALKTEKSNTWPKRKGE